MRTLLKIMSYVSVVLGLLALIGSNGDGYAITGGGLFLAQGTIALIYLEKENK